jgi:hypothetical protein
MSDNEVISFCLEVESHMKQVRGRLHILINNNVRLSPELNDLWTAMDEVEDAVRTLKEKVRS